MFVCATDTWKNNFILKYFIFNEILIRCNWFIFP